MARAEEQRLRPRNVTEPADDNALSQVIMRLADIFLAVPRVILALAMAQATGASGKALLTAIIAGTEVMGRIGVATLHSPEVRGFHAPGITGPFGAAAACASPGTAPRPARPR